MTAILREPKLKKTSTPKPSKISSDDESDQEWIPGEKICLTRKLVQIKFFLPILLQDTKITLNKRIPANLTSFPFFTK